MPAEYIFRVVFVSSGRLIILPLLYNEITTSQEHSSKNVFCCHPIHTVEAQRDMLIVVMYFAEIERFCVHPLLKITLFIL